MLPRAVKNLIVKIESLPPIKVSVQKICRLYVRHKYGCKRNCKLVFFPNYIRGATGDMLYLFSALENSSNTHNYCIVVVPNSVADSIAQLFPALKKSLSYSVSELDEHLLVRGAEMIVQDVWPLQPCDHFLQRLMDSFPAGLSARRQVKIENSDKEVFALFRSLSCKRRKTVLICPDSSYTPVSAPDEYWIGYAEEVEKRGYVPIFNSSKKFGSFESIFLGRRETILFVALAGNIIGIRSGLLDILLYFTDARAIVFYTANPRPRQGESILNFRDNPAKRFMEYLSLRKIFPHQDIKECIFNNEYVFWD